LDEHCAFLRRFHLFEGYPMKLPLIAVASWMMLATSSFAMSDADCTAMWKQADANNDGQLGAGEVDRYAASMRAASKTSAQQGVLTQSEFMDNCRADVFTASTDEGAPLKGANSFTENQAKDRIAAAGFSDVSALTKDDDGIWRGTANKDGKSVKVAVDYKGNVVAN
jgi:putative membrane protein